MSRKKTNREKEGLCNRAFFRQAWMKARILAPAVGHGLETRWWINLPKFMNTDLVVVGAGIVGLSTAWRFSQRFPNKHIVVVEKESRVAFHQTGRNSGVIHSGIYYKPGSFKAKNCVEGRRQLVSFCQKHAVAHEVCGKVIVAISETERERLHQIYERGQKNGIENMSLISRKEMLEIEPHVRGVEAVRVGCTGIVDFAGVCRKLKELLEQGGHELRFNTKVTGVTNKGGEKIVHTNQGEIKTRWLINCAGLQSDLVARSAHVDPGLMIVPFRGEYYELKPEYEYLVKHLIYPLPNPDFPFLGVHFTRMALGGIECGPNAVFAFKREGYGKLQIDVKNTAEVVAYSGFRKMAAKHWRMGLDEYKRSFFKAAFVRGLQSLIPEIRAEYLKPSPSGVRAMALKPDGEIVDDFHFVPASGEVHVLNAPSPAATSGLSLGAEIVRFAETIFDIN